MKGIRHVLKRWLGDRRGFTLMEITIAMAVGSFVMGGVFLVYNQLFNVTATNSNYMAAFRQVQNAGDWITNDTLMAQKVYEMASTTLALDADPGDTEISVTEISIDAGDTTYFPDSGVICIGNDLIQYAGIDYDNDKFTDCTWETGAITHSPDASVTFFVSLGWVDWEGNQHQVVYNLNDDRELIRTYLKMDFGTPDWELQTSSGIAEAIEPIDWANPEDSQTSSIWNYGEHQLEVQLTADTGGYILGRFGFQSYEATRTYIIHPRPIT